MRFAIITTNKTSSGDYLFVDAAYFLTLAMAQSNFDLSYPEPGTQRELCVVLCKLGHIDDPLITPEVKPEEDL